MVFIWENIAKPQINEMNIKKLESMQIIQGKAI